MNDSHILSVSALTQAIKGNLEGAFPFVWVRGQVTNVARPASGHVYFSLRDEEATLAAVWFKQNQKKGERFDPLTGEIYEEGPRPSLASTLENGQELVCAGRLAVYAPRGQYHIVVELGQDVGLGRLHAEFTRLREKLSAEGLFAPERKRPLPPHPQRVAVVTSPQGAAIIDFLRRATERGCGTQIRIYPALVQGEGAPQQICRQLARIQTEGWADAIVLIRGGGSLEDLWAFNSEALARAIAASTIPVVAGIGHEVDFSLADMVADVRAATPTHAAQLLWPEREELFLRLEGLRKALARAGRQSVEKKAGAYLYVKKGLQWHSPQRLFERWQEQLTAVTERVSRLAMRRVENRLAKIEDVQNFLQRTPASLPRSVARLEGLEYRLAAQYEAGFARAMHELDRLLLRLDAANPHAPLERGYALVRRRDGHFVKRKDMVGAGDVVTITVHDGEFSARVDTIL